MKRLEFLAASAAFAAVPPGQPYPVVTPIPPNPLPGYNSPFLPQLTIGVNVTLSGELAPYGQQVVAGVQAAVDEQNHFNAPIGHVWGLRAYDDRNDPAQAGANVQIAAADSTVVGIVGNLTAPMTLAALSRYANVGFAVAVPTVTADAITKRGYFNIFRLPASDTAAGGLFAGVALTKKGVPALAVALDEDYGYDVARGFVQAAKTNGHPADVLLFPKDNSVDPASAAKTVLDRRPEYVFLAGKTAQLGPIAEAMQLAGYTGEFGASDGFYNQQTIDRYAKILNGALVASPMPPLDKVPTALQLLGDFLKEVGQITPFSAFGYGAAQLLIVAAQAASATTRATLLSTLQHGGTYTTLVGQFRFNLNGDPQIPNIYLYKVESGTFTFARPAVYTGFVL
ncbi:MAG: branched-chain amino acid ABC transporter substrate-binding protein [Candidatus Eremiobacteraeota bacterium]|nr:branched-chain amino acid ABC transporter substrate-binding protein [Candidatus Eremiobacteraeota bacterium]